MPVPETYKPSDTKPESKHLRAEDYPLDQKWRLRIEDVNLETLPARDGKGERKRLILSFEGREKTLVLNATNQVALESRLGPQPNEWVGGEIVLHRTLTNFAGDTVPALRIIEARKTAKPKAKPKPVEDVTEETPDDTVPF